MEIYISNQWFTNGHLIPFKTLHKVQTKMVFRCSSRMVWLPWRSSVISICPLSKFEVSQGISNPMKHLFLHGSIDLFLMQLVELGKRLMCVDDVAMNCSLRHISVIVKQYDSVAQMQRFQDIWDSYWHLKISPLISANSSRRVANSLTCRHWRWTKPHWKCCRSAVPRGCRVAKCSAFTERQGVGTGSLIQTYLTLSK